MWAQGQLQMEGEGEGTSLVWEVWRAQVMGPAQKSKLQATKQLPLGKYLVLELCTP